MQPICASSALEEGGAGVRFTLNWRGRTEPAFVLRHGGVARAYLNRCAHKLVELDWEEGRFLDAERRLIVCASHGALYDPATGRCVAGPCRGGRLVAVAVHEQDNAVWLAEPVAPMIR